MTAAQHSSVWHSIADKLDRLSKLAEEEGADGAKISMLQLSVFATVIAAAYNDAAKEFETT